MRRRCLLILTILLSVTIICGCEEESVDQQQLNDNGSYFIAGNHEVAQTFIPSVIGTLTQISVKIVKYNGCTIDYQNIPPGDLQIEIQSTENNPAIPSGETLASMIIDESSIPNTEPFWLFVQFNNPSFLEKDKSYAIVMKQLFTPDSNTYIMPIYTLAASTNPLEDPYEFGNAMERESEISDWTISDSSYEDCVFETYMETSSIFNRYPRR